MFSDSNGTEVINDFVAGARSYDVINLLGVSAIADSIKILGVNVGALDADDFLA